jgi:hypothetical protein
MAKPRAVNSAVVIAKLLDTEGFTDFTANRVENWWKHNRVQTDGQRRRVEKLEDAFSKFAADLTQQERYLLGKFIGMKCKQNFECGIAIGLTVAAVNNAQDVVIEH